MMALPRYESADAAPPVCSASNSPPPSTPFLKHGGFLPSGPLDPNRSEQLRSSTGSPGVSLCKSGRRSPNRLSKWHFTWICFDNAMAESFFGALKNERVSRMACLTREAARQDISRYIELWYNRRRFHSAVEYRPPREVHAEYTGLRIAA